MLLTIEVLVDMLIWIVQWIGGGCIVCLESEELGCDLTQFLMSQLRQRVPPLDDVLTTDVASLLATRERL